jgi:hypothetical protein
MDQSCFHYASIGVPYHNEDSIACVKEKPYVLIQEDFQFCKNTNDFELSTLQSLRPDLNWYSHFSNGVCDIGNNGGVDACYDICASIPGCAFFSTSTVTACYACFIYTSCDNPITSNYDYQIYAMKQPQSSDEVCLHSVISATAGYIVEPFIVVDNHVSVPEGTPMTDGELSFDIICTAAATLEFDAEILAKNDGSNSFYVALDSYSYASEAKTWHTRESSDFRWRRVSRGYAYSTLNFEVSAGEHRLIFLQREDGIKIKSVRFRSGYPECQFVTPGLCAYDDNLCYVDTSYTNFVDERCIEDFPTDDLQGTWYRMYENWNRDNICDDRTCAWRCDDDGVAIYHDKDGGYGPGDLIHCYRKPAAIQECPAEARVGDSCERYSEGLSCDLGEECCCDVCHPSMHVVCEDGIWQGFYTDACMMPCPEEITTIVCTATTYGYWKSLLYNGEKLSYTGKRHKWTSQKTFVFDGIVGAALEIQAFCGDKKGRCPGHGCHEAGLILECDNGFYSNTDKWTSVGFF